MDTETLNVEKLLFFVVPIAFVLLGIGMCRIPNRYHVRTAAVLICCCILLYNSVAMCYFESPKFDGPECSIIVPHKISDILKQNKKGLLVMNTAARRYLLSVAHAIEVPVDIRIVCANKIESEMPGISNHNTYDVVFVANCYVGYEKQSFFSLQDMKVISNYLAEQGYRPIERCEFGLKTNESSLMVFENNGVPDTKHQDSYMQR